MLVDITQKGKKAEGTKGGEPGLHEQEQFVQGDASFHNLISQFIVAFSVAINNDFTIFSIFCDIYLSLCLV